MQTKFVRCDFVFVLSLLVLVWEARVWAYDQQVSSTLLAEGYSIYTPEGEQIRRRRFVEDLYLGAWNLLTGSADPYYRGPRLSFELALRLDTDFGIGRSESSPSNTSNYVPGVRPLQMDAMVAYVDIRGLWNETLRASTRTSTYSAS